MNSAVMKSLKSDSSAQLWPAEEPRERRITDSFYGRVALMETVLTIRDRRRSSLRRFVVLSLVIMGSGVVAAAIMGWL